MNVYKWANIRRTMFFAPDDGGGSASASASPSAPSGGDGGGAVSSPSSDGVGEAGSASASPSPDSSVKESASPWDNIGSSDDLDAIEVSPAPVAPVPPTPPVAPVPPAPVAAEPTPTAPTPNQVQPEPQSQAVAPLSPSDPVAIAQGMEANRDAVIAHLASTKFALSQEDITALETDVVAAVPQIMSRVFFETQVAMQKFLAQAVPGMVEKHQTVTKANTDAETKFFTTHKALGIDQNNPQHKAVVTRIASLYRQANPDIKLDQLIAEVGPMVAASLRLAPSNSPAPQIPGQPRGGNAFRPAVNGGGGAPPVAEPANAWAGLGQVYD